MVTVHGMWKQLSFILEQSARGNHHLFEQSWLQDALARPRSALRTDPSTVAATDALVDALRSAEDLSQQRERLRSADPDARALFVRLYFDFLDRFVSEGPSAAH